LIWGGAALQICRAYGAGLPQAALGKDLETAQAVADAAVEKIQSDGAQFRRDIAAKMF
jgi:phosphoribosylamine-glycine ligase